MRLRTAAALAFLCMNGCGEDDANVIDDAAGTGGSNVGGSSAEGGASGGGTSAGGSSTGGSNTGGTSVGGSSGGSAGAGDCPKMLTDDDRVYPEVALEWLNIHNEARHRYCIPPLQWDQNLARIAQDYAEKGAWWLPHNPDRSQQYADLIGCTADCPSVGENIHFHAPWDFFPFSSCLDGWLEEEDANQCNEGGLHYLAMMSMGYDRVGCGGWIDPADDYWHVVCDYAGSEPYDGTYPFSADKCSCTPEPFVRMTTDCFLP